MGEGNGVPPGLFEEIARTARIPDPGESILGGRQCIVRDMQVDLAQLHERIFGGGLNPFLVFVYSDVVTFPTGFSWGLEGAALVIASRRIEAGARSSVKIDLRRNPRARLLVYADELDGELDVFGVTGTDRPEIASQKLGPLESAGVRFVLRGNRFVRVPVERLREDMLEVGSTFNQALVTSFQFATVLVDREPELAGAMFEWVRRNTDDNAGLPDLHLQAASMLALVVARSGSSTFVPTLSRALYTETAEGYAVAAQAFEEHYDRLADRGLAIEDRVEAARLMLDLSDDEVRYERKLTEQFRGNVENADHAVRAAQKLVRSQQDNVEQAAAAFQSGVEQFKKEQQIELGFTIAMSLIDFATAIGSIAVGAGELGVPKAFNDFKKAEKALKAVEQKGADLFENAVDLDQIDDVFMAIGAFPDELDEAVAAAVKSYGVLTKEISGTMQLLLKATESVSKSLKAGRTIVQLSQKLSKNPKALERRDIPELGDKDMALAPTFWEQFRLENAEMLRGAIKAGISGAGAYQLQLETLALYGKALADNQIALVHRGQELARQLMAEELAARKHDQLAEEIEKLTASNEPNTALMQSLFQRYLDVKSSLFVALEYYIDAYRYWALRESDLSPSMVSRVAELRAGLAKVQDDYIQALDQFRPNKPQSFEHKTCVVDTEDAVSSLRKRGEASFQIPLDHPTFEGADRVRVREVRAWLVGARPASPRTEVKVSIRNNGVYRDRLSDQRGSSATDRKVREFDFTTEALERGFHYRIRDGELELRDVTNEAAHEITHPGKVADELRYAFFEPTPFSDWTVSVPAPLNPELDLSGVVNITLEFSGNFIDQVQRRPRA